MRTTTTIPIILALSFAVLFAGPGCKQQESFQRINMEKRIGPIRPTSAPQKHLRIAIGGMITPREGFAYYRRLLDYMGEKLGMPVDLVDREDYAEINRLVKNGKVDVAFVCGGPYVDGHQDFGMELLAAPFAYGGTEYYSYIIVPRESPARSFGELRGKTFAFSDPLSNSGKLVPTYLLARMGETPETFFRKTIYSHAHDRSIVAVAENMVDGAAVDSLVWEYENRMNPVFTSQTRIIQRSPPYGIPPVVANPRLPSSLKQQVREVLLKAHLDSKGRDILHGMMIDRFVPIDDHAYDSIREMKAWLAREKGGQ